MASQFYAPNIICSAYSDIFASEVNYKQYW